MSAMLLHVAKTTAKEFKHGQEGLHCDTGESTEGDV